MRPRQFSVEQLLTALLVHYWRGGVEQGDAAKLLGMRKDEFAELAALRKCELIVDDLTWRHYLSRFNQLFPECDRNATKRNVPDWHKPEGRMYTEAELLKPPHHKTMREALRGTENSANAVKWYPDIEECRPPRFQSPALVQVKGQQLLRAELEEQPALPTEGAEFDFAA